MRHMIRVDDVTYERLRKHVYELHLPFGKVIDILLDGYDAGSDTADLRTPEQRQRDYDAATLDPRSSND